MNQIVVNPAFQQDDAIAASRERGIPVVAFSPLGIPNARAYGGRVMLQKPIGLVTKLSQVERQNYRWVQEKSFNHMQHKWQMK